MSAKILVLVAVLTTGALIAPDARAQGNGDNLLGTTLVAGAQGADAGRDAAWRLTEDLQKNDPERLAALLRLKQEDPDAFAQVIQSPPSLDFTRSNRMWAWENGPILTTEQFDRYLDFRADQRYYNAQFNAGFYRGFFAEFGRTEAQAAAAAAEATASRDERLREAGPGLGLGLLGTVVAGVGGLIGAISAPAWVPALIVGGGIYLIVSNFNYLETGDEPGWASPGVEISRTIGRTLGILTEPDDGCP